MKSSVIVYVYGKGCIPSRCSTVSRPVGIVTRVSSIDPSLQVGVLTHGRINVISPTEIPSKYVQSCNHALNVFGTVVLSRSLLTCWSALLM